MTGSIRNGGWIVLAFVSQFAWAEPGYRWEMTMEMNGMVMPGMGSSAWVKDVVSLEVK